MNKSEVADGIEATLATIGDALQAGNLLHSQCKKWAITFKDSDVSDETLLTATSLNIMLTGAFTLFYGMQANVINIQKQMIKNLDLQDHFGKEKLDAIDNQIKALHEMVEHLKKTAEAIHEKLHEDSSHETMN